MKSKTTKDLINWLNHMTRDIDMPRDFSVAETKRIVDIAETELVGGNVNDKITDFRLNYYKDCNIKSERVKGAINEMIARLRPEDDLLLSERQVIEMVELAEGEITG